MAYRDRSSADSSQVLPESGQYLFAPGIRDAMAHRIHATSLDHPARSMVRTAPPQT
jgi:hypothetical protein